MKIAIVNESLIQGLSFLVVQKMANAISRQANEDFSSLWQAGPVSIRAVAQLKDALPDECIAALLNDSDQADALAYHDTTPDGRPYQRIFGQTILDNGGDLLGPNGISAALSHEILETLGDPYCNWWALGPDGKFYAQESCDAVEEDSYEIDGVHVSNFVGPRFFSAGPGPYDWMGRVKKPFETRPGGYQIICTNPNDVTQIFGEKYPEWRKEMKTHPASRTVKRAIAVPQHALPSSVNP